MNRTRIILALTFLAFNLHFPNLTAQIENLITNKQSEVDGLKAQWESKVEELKDLKLQWVIEELEKYGAPKDPLNHKQIQHRAMWLGYSEEHLQPAWVYHIIMPDIAEGSVSRSNDFRPDTKLPNGKVTDNDYFFKSVGANGEDVFKSHGYDRGHMAPSADFRWHAEALSESYFYSNISPQLPEFNRESWAEIEELMRTYVLENQNPLLVVTGFLPEKDLPSVPNSFNHVSIPRWYFKVALDPTAGKSIAFWVPHRHNTEPANFHQRTINEVEEFTGLDFFPHLKNQESIENQKIKQDWFPESTSEDVSPLTLDKLPNKAFNTDQAKYHENTGKEVVVCGTVVGTFVSKKGNVFLYLDHTYPRQYFSVMVGKDLLKNFSYAPNVFLKGKVICATGNVVNTQGKPAIFLDNERKLEILKP